MMAGDSSISWTEKTWNPIAGCSIVSPGCTNCYAMKMAHRINRMKPDPASHYFGTTKVVNGNAVWTGVVNPAPEHILLAPLKWKKPRMIFVNSMSDLFHESVPDALIDKVFAVMALCPQHTFQCLTKRSKRMSDYCSASNVTHRIAKAIDAIHVDLDHQPEELWIPVPDYEQYEASTHGRVRRNGLVLKEQINERFDRACLTLWRDNEPKTAWVHTLVLSAHRGKAPVEHEACHHNGNSRDNRLANLFWGTRDQNQRDKVRHGANGGPAKITREQSAEIRAACGNGETQQSIADRYGISRSLVSMIKDRKVWPDAIEWPLPNVHLGVSCEDQTRADERIPDLLATPAAVRFVSAEPLLGPITFRGTSTNGQKCWNWLTGEYGEMHGDGPDFETRAKIDWIIAGSESGKGARLGRVDWFRSIKDQSLDAGVAFFLKQYATAAGKKIHLPELDGQTWQQFPQITA